MMDVNNQQCSFPPTIYRIQHIAYIIIQSMHIRHELYICHIQYPMDDRAGVAAASGRERAMPYYCCDEIYIFPALQQQQGEVALTCTATATRSCQATI